MNLVDTYNSNITSIYQRIISLYNKASPYFDSEVEVPELKLVPLNNPSKKLNLVVFLWTIDCIKQLERAVNNLIKTYNDSLIINYQVGETPDIVLWLPECLAVDDDYNTKLSGDFEKCNKALDQLETNLEPFLVDKKITKGE